MATPDDVMTAEEAQAWRDDGVDGNRDEIRRLCDTIIALHQHRLTNLARALPGAGQRRQQGHQQHANRHGQAQLLPQR